MRTAVIIPTYRRPECLLQTLEDLRAQSQAADEIVVVDQDARHAAEEAERVRELCTELGATLLEPSWSQLPRARNLGLAAITAGLVVFIDDDVRLPSDFLAAHRACYDDPQVQAVAGRVFDRQKSDHARRLSGGAQSPAIDLLPPEALDPAIGWFHLDLVHTRLAQWVLTARGCNMSFRASFLRQHDLGFDERFKGTAVREESDICLRLQAAGGRVWYQPAAHLEHLNSPAGGCRPAGRERWADKVAFYHNHHLMALKSLDATQRRRFGRALFRCHALGLPPCNKARRLDLIAGRTAAFLAGALDARRSLARLPERTDRAG
ncbi:MAG: glycosyltransferase [Acidobacteriota bacterium]